MKKGVWVLRGNRNSVFLEEVRASKTNNLEHTHPAWLKGLWGERQTDRDGGRERENMALAQGKNPDSWFFSRLVES